MKILKCIFYKLYAFFCSHFAFKPWSCPCRLLKDMVPRVRQTRNYERFEWKRMMCVDRRSSFTHRPKKKNVFNTHWFLCPSLLFLSLTWTQIWHCTTSWTQIHAHLQTAHESDKGVGNDWSSNEFWRLWLILLFSMIN